MQNRRHVCIIKEDFDKQACICNSLQGEKEPWMGCLPLILIVLSRLDYASAHTKTHTYTTVCVCCLCVCVCLYIYISICEGQLLNTFFFFFFAVSAFAPD